MCLAIPGKVVKINDGKATVQYPSCEREAALISDDISTGDYVIVQAGIVVDKVPAAEAKEALKAWAKLK